MNVLITDDSWDVSESTRERTFCESLFSRQYTLALFCREVLTRLEDLLYDPSVILRVITFLVIMNVALSLRSVVSPAPVVVYVPCPTCAMVTDAAVQAREETADADVQTDPL